MRFESAKLFFFLPKQKLQYLCGGDVSKLTNFSDGDKKQDGNFGDRQIWVDRKACEPFLPCE